MPQRAPHLDDDRRRLLPRVRAPQQQAPPRRLQPRDELRDAPAARRLRWRKLPAVLSIIRMWSGYVQQCLILTSSHVAMISVDQLYVITPAAM